MRDSIFISHATLGQNEEGLDNDFASWLSLRLIGMGYKVWCDLNNLKGGEDFWAEIEAGIRNNSIKYLYVLSSKSNHREGTLKELAVALKVKKQLDDPHFIIPLHIDKSLSHNDINIDLIRLNSINFKEGWSKGLENLLERLNEDKVPQPTNTNYGEVTNIWQTVLAGKNTAIEKEEIYSSNWFPIAELPERLYFHRFGNLTPLHTFPLWDCKYPAAKFGQYLATFAQYGEFADVVPDFVNYDPNESKSFAICELLQRNFDNGFIKHLNAKNLMVQLLNVALNRYIASKGLRKYSMANHKKAFWFEQGVLEKDKINKVLMIGKLKYGKDNHLNWHFGISGTVKLDLANYFTISSHIIFTWDGKRIVNDDAIQHRCRRRQGRNWWNKHWREKLINCISHISNAENLIVLGVGREEAVKLSNIPYQFRSPLGYLDPDESNLIAEDEDVELTEGAEGIEAVLEDEEAEL